jgi:hypothetical protein
MTPAKEKAKELVDKYYQLAEDLEWTTDSETKEKAEKFNDELGADVLTYWNELAKQCALIAVDEILDSHYKLLSGVNTTTYNYWKEVKNEINNL